MPTLRISKNLSLPKPHRAGGSHRLLNWLIVAALLLGPLLIPLPVAAQAPTPWTPQGPAPELDGQQDLANLLPAQEPVSGNVVSIAASPTNADLLYIATANGGVWKSTNATAANPTWTPLTDNLKSLAIGVVALDLTDATDQTLVAGTGRFSGFASIGDDRMGLYYTTNGGTTWTVTTSPLLSAANINGVAARGTILMATSANGLFRSTGGPLGAWSKISGAGNLPNAPATGLTADPNNPNRFYVQFSGVSGGIFRTEDVGATWTNVSAGINLSTNAPTCFSAAVGPAGVVYAALNGLTNTLYRSADNGATWTSLNAPSGQYACANGSSGIALSADKTNANLVYLASYATPIYRVDATQPSGAQVTLLTGPASTTLLAGTNATQTGIFVGSVTHFPTTTPFIITLDNEQLSVTNVTATSWYWTLTVTRGANGTTPATHSYGTVIPFNTSYGNPHPDHAALTVAANGALLNGNHGGIFRLANPSGAASAANVWVSVNGTLAASEIHNIAYDNLSNVLVGGFQDNGSAYQTAPNSPAWTRGLSSGDGGDVAVDDVTQAGSGQSLRYASAQLLGGFSRYVFNAANALVSATTLNTAAIIDKQFVTPVVLNKVDPKRLLIGGSGNLWESLDMGATIASAFPAGVTPVGVTGSQSPLVYGGYQNGVANPDLFYFGSGNKIYKRTAAGGAVTQAAALPAGATTIADIVLYPTDWLRLFAVDSDQVFRSTDGGNSWTDITGSLISSGLSSTEITPIEFVAGPSPYLAVGTRSGVFASQLSNLGTWVKLGGSLPDALVYDLEYDAADDVLAIATLGRGGWLLPNASAAFVPSSVAPTLTLSGPTTTNEGATEYSYSFTVNDPGDRFTVSSPTITGGSLVAGSLLTTSSGGSFKVTFPDGPATATISLQVTDSTGLTSNTASTNVTVANVIPSSVTINGAPASSTVGTPINVTATATDPSAVDSAAGIRFRWKVTKDGYLVVQSTTAVANTSFSYTPSSAGSYTVILDAYDKDNGNRWATKVINVTAAVLAAAALTAPQAQAAPNVVASSQLLAADQAATTAPLAIAAAGLTAAAASVTVGEGQPAENAGTYTNANGNPVTLSASVGTLTQVPQIGCETPLPNLVSWWHAEGNANDAIGSNHGTLQNGAGFATGIVGQAFSFDGIDDVVNIPSNASIDLRNNLTVMAWFKINSMAPNANAKIFSKRNAASTFGPFEINLFYDGANVFASTQGSTNNSSWDASIVSAQPLSFGNWYHVAFVVDSNNLHTFYLNGQSQGTQQLPALLKASTGNAFTIGTTANGFPFNGLVDEVEIINHPVSASEIQAIYSNCPAPAIAGTWSWSYTPDDNAPSQDVTITATDNVNSEVTTLPFTLLVENAPPAATLGNNGPVNEGSTATVAFTNQADPSTADTTAGLRYAYDFDNDGVFEIGGDGTYANAVTAASATVPASFLSEGPGTRTVRGRIIDKDGGYTDYTTDVTINNAAPAAAVSGPASALANQVVNVVLTAVDGSSADQQAGFTYSVNWGDGSPAQTVSPVVGTGDATASHAYASAGNYTIQVTASDKDGATGTAGSAGISVNALSAGSLQALIATQPLVTLAPVNSAALQSAVAAINSLTAPATPVQLTLRLGSGPYSGVTLSPPANIILNLAGNYTADNLADMTRIVGASPAVTVAGGEVFVQGANLSTDTDSPTILVSGGHLTIGQNRIEESTTANNAAIKVTGGVVDYGFDVLTNINGDGGFFDIANRNVLRFPEGIDDFLVPNLFSKDGAMQSAAQPSATSLTSSPANTSNAGQAVTFSAVVNVNVARYGQASGLVDFYDDATLLGSVPLQVSGGTTAASFTTSSLSVGSHAITAVYNGDTLFVGSSTELTHVVNSGPANNPPVAQGQTVTTNQNTPLAITLVASDADNNPLTYSIVAQPAHGTLTGTAPNVTYTPASGYSGSDSFTFKANDGLADSNIATVSITVNSGPVNNPPVANNDTYGTLVNTALTIAAPGVLGNDSDPDGNPLTAVKLTNPTRGTVTLNANGSFTYVPTTGFVGTDSFTYQVSDGALTSIVATVTLVVNGKVTAQIQQVSFRTTSVTTTPDPTYPAQSPRGVAVLTLAAKNLGVGLRNVSFRVVRLTQNNYLLNADGGPGRVGSRLSVANSVLPGGNQAWDRNEALTQAFRVGLLSNKSFTLQLDVYATKLAVTAADAAPTGTEEIEELVGTFAIEVDPEALTIMGNTIYLPQVSR